MIPTVLIIDPEHARKILLNTKETQKNFIYTFMDTFLGHGLLTTSGTKWRTHRRLIQPFFHLNTLNLFIDTFAESSEILVQELRGKSEVKISSLINVAVLKILHSALMGIPVRDHDTQSISPFNKGHLVMLQRLTRPWYILDHIYKFSSISKYESTQRLTLKEFAKKILDERRANVGEVEWCLLDSLIKVSETNPHFNDENIVDEICTFMLAGQDSVGSATSFTLYNLAKHPEIQQNVVEELDAVFRDYGGINGKSLNKMVYMEQCIKETLRLYPSVPVISKKLVEEVQLGSYTLPKDLNVLISLIGMQRLEDCYPNPNKFDPERFSPSNQKGLNQNAYIPFSAGPRNCVANKFALMEMKAIIAMVLRHFEITLPPDYQLQLRYRVTLRAKGGIRLRLQPREQSDLRR